MKTKKLEVDVPIGGYDIDMFTNLVNYNEEFTWTFTTKDGQEIDIKFIVEDLEHE